MNPHLLLEWKWLKSKKGVPSIPKPNGGLDAGRTDHEKDEDEGAEQCDGVIVPPYLLRESRKTSVRGDGERDKKQDGCTN